MTKITMTKNETPDGAFGYIKTVDRKLAVMGDTIHVDEDLSLALREYGEAWAEHQEASQAFLAHISKHGAGESEELLALAERLETAANVAHHEAEMLASTLWEHRG